MPEQRTADHAGTIALGDLTVRRLGFGSMRLTGEGVWGAPDDPETAKAVLRRAIELGIDLIDTADSYGPYVTENLIREALHPYPDGLVIATKAGLERTGPGEWPRNGHPDHLREAVHGSLKRLGVERIDLLQLHAVDPQVPLEDVLDVCTERRLAFIPWFPLAAGPLARRGGPLDRIAERHDATPSQIALAWLLQRSPAMLPIPGTSSIEHLEDNVGAARIELSDEDVAELERS